MTKAKASRIPKVKNFLLADSVFQQISKKYCIIGVFSRIHVKSFPSLHHSLGLFVQLTDAQGDYDVRVEFLNSAGQVLSQLAGIRMKVESPLALVEFGIQTYNIPLPAPGQYRFRIYFNDEPTDTEIPIEAVPLGG